MPMNHRFLAIVFTSVLIGTIATFGVTMLKTQIDRITNRFITTRSRKVSLAKFVDLPLEVLVEILVLLEWKDILRTRQTCQRLRDASLSRPVWLSLVQWYSATIQPRPFFPEKPLDLYTARELEYLILKWQSGKAVRTLTQPRELSLSIPQDYLQSVHLIQGGRWLVFGARDGSVKYHDLNSPLETSEAVTLVSSHFGQDANTIIRLSVEMDSNAEYTTFNVGIMSWRVPPPDGDPDYPNPPHYTRWIEVSRVTSCWDENGRVKGLRSERLASFCEEYMCGCDSFTLRGQHVAYSLYSFEQMTTVGDGENIAIVDWTLADSTSLAYPRRLIWRCRAEWLALLPDNKLLCDESGEIQLFDLRNAPVTTLFPTQRNQPPRQDPIACIPLYMRAISQPYLIHDSIRFSVLTREGVKGLIISHASGISHAMDCIDLLAHPNFCDSAQMGYNRAVLCCFPEPIVLQYGWPEEHSSAVVSQSSTIQTRYSEMLFDEYSSRSVTLGVGSMIESILDLAAI